MTKSCYITHAKLNHGPENLLNDVSHDSLPCRYPRRDGIYARIRAVAVPRSERTQDSVRYGRGRGFDPECRPNGNRTQFCHGHRAVAWALRPHGRACETCPAASNSGLCRARHCGAVLESARRRHETQDHDAARISGGPSEMPCS